MPYYSQIDRELILRTRVSSDQSIHSSKNWERNLDTILEIIEIGIGKRCCRGEICTSAGSVEDKSKRPTSVNGENDDWSNCVDRGFNQARSN